MQWNISLPQLAHRHFHNGRDRRHGAPPGVDEDLNAVRGAGLLDGLHLDAAGVEEARDEEGDGDEGCVDAVE